MRSPEDTELSLPSRDLYSLAASVLRRLLPSRGADHDDLLQTALERVVQSVRAGRFSNRCSLATWVSVIARHVAIDEMRARRRSLLVCADTTNRNEWKAGQTSAFDIDDIVDARIILNEVRSILARIDPHQANTIFLHDMLVYDLAETASSTGVSWAAAQSRLIRGRKQLRRQLSEERRELPGSSE